MMSQGLRTALVSCLLLGACESAPEATDPTSSAVSVAADADIHDPVALQVPAWTNEGKELEVAKLYEDARLKVAAIALRRGTELPVHEVDAKVTIHVLSGGGELTVDGSPMPVSSGSIVVLAPAAPHAMIPADDALVVLLVHYLKG